MSNLKFICCLALPTFVAMAAQASDRPAATEWKTECVGRLQLKLPGNVEHAALPAAAFKSEFKGAASESGYAFPDGQPASETSFFYGGSLFVTHELDKATQSNFRLNAKSWKADLSSTVNKEHRKGADGKPMVYEDLHRADSPAIGWRVDNLFTSYIDVGKTSLLWKVRGAPDSFPFLRRDYLSLTSGAISRESFSVPSGPGVCLPYSFISDDGKTDRAIAMTYRLVSHPDITVWLEDASAATYKDLRREQRSLPLYQIADFWAQYKHYDEKLISLWTAPGVRPVGLNGITGLASFMKIVRGNKSEDFAYLAIVRGIPRAAKDTPDVRLLVVRDSVKARERNVVPLDEKSFLELAEGVASSVIGRPIR
jgi:hypothetical protein